MLAIGRLEGKEEVVKGEVEIELVEDDLPKELVEERELGDRAVVLEVVWVKVVLLEERTNNGGLENVRVVRCCWLLYSMADRMCARQHSERREKTTL